MTKHFGPPENPNYAATVIRVNKLVPLAGCDNLVGLPLFGLQAIVSKDTAIGDIGVLIPAECQVSEAFAAANNLYRHPEKNADFNVSGYMEDNRRVRAIKLRGHRSDALYLPVSSLGFTGLLVDLLKDGDTFDCLNGVDVCQKYVVKTRVSREFVGQAKAEARVDARVFPQHFDSLNWHRVDRTFPPDTQVIVTQKIHGTSIRVGHVPVKRPLSLVERFVKRWLGAKVQETEFDYVYGSRKVIKDAENPLQNHFYDHDLWSEEGAKLIGKLPENYIVYGELIGWTDGGGAIQKDYTYDCLPGTRDLYIYRVSVVNAQGVVADLSWDALMAFCGTAGLEFVPELWRGPIGDFKVEDWIDTTFYPKFLQSIPLCDESPCDEGVCLRFEGMIPEIYKLKSPIFLGHETAMLDAAVEDIEAQEFEPEPEAEGVPLP